MRLNWTTSSTSWRTVLVEGGERIVEIVHREHDAEVAERVYRCVPVIGDRRRRKKARELDLAVAVRHTHHGDLDALVAQSSDAPFTSLLPRWIAPSRSRPQPGEKGDGGINPLHHDADVVHPSKRHAAISLVDLIGCPPTRIGARLVWGA